MESGLQLDFSSSHPKTRPDTPPLIPQEWQFVWVLGVHARPLAADQGRVATVGTAFPRLACEGHLRRRIAKTPVLWAAGLARDKSGGALESQSTEIYRTEIPARSGNCGRLHESGELLARVGNILGKKRSPHHARSHSHTICQNAMYA